MTQCNSVHSDYGRCELKPHKDMPHRARGAPVVVQRMFLGRVYEFPAAPMHHWSDHDPKAKYE